MTKKTHFYKNGETLELSTGNRYHIIITSILPVALIEFPDILFNLNSAVPCLDENENLIYGLCNVFFYAKEHPEEEILFVGHTDTSGETEVNYPLSELRAQAVLSIFSGDENMWLNAVNQFSKIEDYQCIFKSLSKLYYWNCNPGEIDDKDGPKTQQSVKGFQHEVNSIFNFGIMVDGIMGPQTWTAVLQVYRRLLTQLGVDLDRDWKLGHNGVGYYGCGESFPIEEAEEDNFVSQTNRRVEIYFGPAGRIKPLKPLSSPKQKLNPSDCILFDMEKCKRKIVGLRSSISVQYRNSEGDPISGITAHLLNESGVEIGEPQVTDDRGFVFWFDLADGNYGVEFEGD